MKNNVVKDDANGLVLTLERAFASATDAATMQAQKRTIRSEWNLEDYNLYCDKLARWIEIGGFFDPQVTERIVRDMRGL